MLAVRAEVSLLSVKEVGSRGNGYAYDCFQLIESDARRVCDEADVREFYS